MFPLASEVLSRFLFSFFSSFFVGEGGGGQHVSRCALFALRIKSTGQEAN